MRTDEETEARIRAVEEDVRVEAEAQEVMRSYWAGSIPY